MERDLERAQVRRVVCWIQLAQTERSGGNLRPAMLDKARRLCARLRIPPRQLQH
ncbi:hypothetical protein GM658_17665 [Pseudoduganella eburnea]|uniref:Uncharacterized protein n=1 Tax=Massilia eburnea TaxID=1776165 RepID=A0A6L6QJI5_9BURK|nr:hypothetical protein [Massilia eburnea]MTW12439.1 hypothetical protein [Massilia eburnea]